MNIDKKKTALYPTSRVEGKENAILLIFFFGRTVIQNSALFDPNIAKDFISNYNREENIAHLVIILVK